MPPKIIRIVNGEIREVDEEPPQQQPRRTVVNGQASESDDDGDDGPRSATDLVAQRLFSGGPASSSSSGPTFDFSKPPLAVAWEDRSSSLAGLPGLSVFGAHLSSRWLVALAAATAVAGLKGLLIASVIWILYKLGFEGGESANRSAGGHQLGAHPHSGALPARALASYLAAAGGGRAGAAAATTATAAAAGAAGGEDVRNATRKAWAAREAAVAAAKAAAAAAGASKE